MCNDSKSWVDIYAPQTWDEYIGHKTEVESIRKKIKSDSLDVIILDGPEGSGKTTLARLIAYDIYGGKEDSRLIDINASDDNGVDVIRTKIKNAVSGRCIDGKRTVILFDEADYMTDAAQAALRRVTEDYKGNAIFIFATNNATRIIKPLRSRAHKTIYYIGHLNIDESRALVQRIVNLRELDIPKEVVDEIVAKSGGDARAIISMLQDWNEGAYMAGDLSRSAKVRQFAMHIIEGSEDDPRVLLPLITDSDLTEILHLFLDTGGDWETKAKIAELLAETDARIQRSHNIDLQLMDMIIKLNGIWW